MPFLYAFCQQWTINIETNKNKQLRRWNADRRFMCFFCSAGFRFPSSTCCLCIQLNFIFSVWRFQLFFFLLFPVLNLRLAFFWCEHILKTGNVNKFALAQKLIDSQLSSHDDKTTIWLPIYEPRTLNAVDFFCCRSQNIQNLYALSRWREGRRLFECSICPSNQKLIYAEYRWHGFMRECIWSVVGAKICIYTFGHWSLLSEPNIKLLSAAPCFECMHPTTCVVGKFAHKRLA